MKVQEGHIPVCLVEAIGTVLVAWCTVCYSRTVKPRRAMLDRHGSVITDGCGDCPSVSAPQPARIEDDGLGPIFIATDHGVLRGWGDLTPQETTPDTPALPRLAGLARHTPQETTPAITPPTPASPPIPPYPRLPWLGGTSQAMALCKADFWCCKSLGDSQTT